MWQPSAPRHECDANSAVCMSNLSIYCHKLPIQREREGLADLGPACGPASYCGRVPANVQPARGDTCRQSLVEPILESVAQQLCSCGGDTLNVAFRSGVAGWIDAGNYQPSVPWRRGRNPVRPNQSGRLRRQAALSVVDHRWHVSTGPHALRRRISQRHQFRRRTFRLHGSRRGLRWRSGKPRVFGADLFPPRYSRLLRRTVRCRGRLHQRMRGIRGCQWRTWAVWIHDHGRRRATRYGAQRPHIDGDVSGWRGRSLQPHCCGIGPVRRAGHGWRQLVRLPAHSLQPDQCHMRCHQSI